MLSLLFSSTASTANAALFVGGLLMIGLDVGKRVAELVLVLVVVAPVIAVDVLVVDVVLVVDDDIVVSIVLWLQVVVGQKLILFYSRKRHPNKFTYSEHCMDGLFSFLFRESKSGVLLSSSKSPLNSQIKKPFNLLSMTYSALSQIDCSLSYVTSPVAVAEHSHVKS
jgi:hypothetical protein